MIYDIMHPGWGEHHLPWVRKEEDDWGDWGAVEQDFNCSFFKLKNWRWMKRLRRSRTSYPRHWVKTKLKYYFGEDMFWSHFDKDTWILYAKTVEVSNEPDNPGIKESICWNVLPWYTAIKF